MKLGYFLSSEEWGPNDIVRLARRAEDAGFHSLWISDHYHPWIDEQRHSPFVWSAIGAIAEATSRMGVTTAVTCPTVRVHPAVIAHAAATCGLLLDGRFQLGVGSGEALNEHIFGDKWPEADVRLEMLEEAVEVIRLLWEGGSRSHRGRHYVVENARIYDLPPEPAPILMSGFGPKATKLAARIADGYVTTFPDPSLIELYRSEGGKGPVHAGTKVCFGPDEAEARSTAHRIWPNEGLSGELAQLLPTPPHFKQATELVTEEMIGGSLPCGPDIDRHLAAMEEFESAGVDELYIQQIGPRQDEFFNELAPRLLERFET